MKLTLLLVMVATLQVTAAGYAQTVTISEKNVSLERVFTEIRKQTGYQFVYSIQMVSMADKVSISLKDASLEDALKAVLRNQPFTYSLIEKTVVIQPKEKPATVLEKFLQAGSPVTGVVRDSTGKGIPGVSVIIKGSGKGVSTDASGRFELKDVEDNATLVFSAVGFQTREVKITATNRTLNISLEAEDVKLSEVIVTGYQTLQKKLFTGASASVKAADAKRDGVPDMSRMLEGQVAGVSVQNVSGTFGAAPKIRIRGATSISGDNKPLWVVDGVILEDVVNISNEQLSTGDPATLVGSSVAGINPDDIESFQVLKDAAATALYGARAMNGVIVVTTKRGKKTDGKPIISYTGSFTTYLKPSYENFDIMNSADQMSVYLDMYNKGWLNHSEVSRAADGGVFHKMYNKMYEYDPITKTFGLRNDAPSRTEFLQRYANANTDWFDVLFKNSFMQEHAVSIMAGTEKSRFYASTSYLGDNGWSMGDKVKRFTGNVRGTFNLSDRLSVELITQGSIRDQRAPGTLGRNSNPVTGRYDRAFDINPFSYALNTSRTLTPYDENGELEYFTRNYAPFNILNELKHNTMELTAVDFKVQAGLKYTVLKGLRYSFDAAYRYAKNEREHKIHENSNMPNAYRADYDATIRDNNRFLYTNPDDPDATPIIVLPYGGFYNTNNDNLTSYYLRNSLEWEKDYNDIHTINLFASSELRYTNRQNKNFDGYGYQYDRGGIPFIDPNIVKQMIESNLFYYGMSYRYDRYLAYMTRAAYSYKGKYNLNATLRYDGSNLLGESRTARWLPTWNVSGAWNIDTEDFFQKQQVLSRATIRGTYGLTASMGAANNSSLVLRNESTRRPYLSEIETALVIGGLENSELTWEKQYETNIGFDLGFLNEKFSLTVDLYNRNAFDLIGAIRTSGIGGEAVKFANYADMKSKGIEVTIGVNVIRSKDWKWRTQINAAYHKGEITKMENNPNIWNLIIPDGGSKKGYPQRGLFSIPFMGLDPNSGYPVFTNENNKTGSEVYLFSQNTDQLKYEGPIDPLLNGGFINNVSYKNFSLSVLVTFSAGNKVRRDPAFKNSYTDLDAMSKDFLHRWTMPGDETRTNVPSILDRLSLSNLGSIYPYNTYNYSTMRVADGDFVRLKQVMVSYQLPKQVLSKLGITSTTFSLVGNNLWLIYSDDKLNGQDPEFYGSGGVALPIPRQISASIKLGF